MKLNRRNTIIGLGTIVAGGGAALGSGAFSSVEARRDLEVNVVTDEDIAEEFVDILIKAEPYGSIGISDDGGDTEAVASDLFPDNDFFSNGGDYNTDNDAGEDAISLVQNDVTIVFGAESEGGTFENLDAIPANSTVTYNNLFEIINDDESGEQDDFAVTFEVDDTSNFDLSFPDRPNLGDPDTDEVFSAGSAIEIATTELTTGASDDSGVLTITIESPS